MAYTLVASKLDRWWITAPMVFVAAGTILGPGVLNVLPFSPSNETILWSIFGGLFVGKLFTLELSAQPIIYAIVSLTLIRMVPVAIVLIGKHLRPATVAFMGWFGPRGLASVVFTLIALQELEHSGGGDAAGADRHLDDLALSGAARHLGVAAGGPVRGVDREGGRGPGAGDR